MSLLFKNNSRGFYVSAFSLFQKQPSTTSLCRRTTGSSNSRRSIITSFGGNLGSITKKIIRLERATARCVTTTGTGTKTVPSTAAVSSEPTKEVKIPRKFVNYPFEYHRELIVRIDTLTNLGMGIARVKLDKDAWNKSKDDQSQQNDKDGDEEREEAMWVVMVPNVIPGELVRCRIFRNHKNYSEADLISVQEASPDRIQKPRCPLSEECGGCQYQHMTIELQREWKMKHVSECFHQNKINLQNEFGIDVQPTMGTSEIFHYRSKITPHYQSPGGQARRRRNRKKRRSNNKETTESAEGQPLAPVDTIGFQRASVRSIVDVPSCVIATEPLNKEYQRIRQELLHQPYHKELGATLLLRQANVRNSTVVTNHKEYMTTYVNGLSFTYLAGNFFQNNLYILPKMVDIVLEKASPPAAPATHGGKEQEVIRMTHFVDCYCGSGLFCLSAAKHFETCVGIEINAKAIEEAQHNAAANDLSHKCFFEASRAEAIFDNPNVQTFPRDKTVVMLDPPRKGCDETFLKQLETFRPQRIVYLSCNPATQARDVSEMIYWGYDITFVQPIDLFPQTRHIESLTVLERQ